MKQFLYTLAGALILVAMLQVTACKSSKPVPVAKQTGAVEIALPFQGQAYRNSATHFRTVNSGNSPDLATAKKIAMVNARAEMAANIQSIIKSVTDNYTQQRKIEDAVAFNTKFEELVRQVVNQQLNQVNILEEKLYHEANGSYTSWVAIEMPVKPIMLDLENNITKDQALRQDYEKMLFERIFNEEMEKLQRERP